MFPSVHKSGILLFIFTILLFGKTSLAQKRNREAFDPPPNIVFINDTLGCDLTEITNIDWLFYNYALKQNDPLHVEKYVPLKAVWWEVNHPELIEGYHHHPKYKMYPVVGLTLQQAQDYAKWRTIVVLKGSLEKRGLISEEERSDFETGDLDNFFLDHPELQSIKYFEYRIPTYNEWLIVKDAFDKHLEIRLKESKRFAKHFKEGGLFNYYEFGWGDSEGNTIGKPMPRDVLSENKIRDKNLLLKDFYGNVAEMISDKPISVGGSWTDSIHEAEINKIQYFKVPNAWTGFRCVGSWKKWRP